MLPSEPPQEIKEISGTNSSNSLKPISHLPKADWMLTAQSTVLSAPADFVPVQERQASGGQWSFLEGCPAPQSSARQHPVQEPSGQCWPGAWEGPRCTRTHSNINVRHVLRTLLNSLSPLVAGKAGTTGHHQLRPCRLQD